MRTVAISVIGVLSLLAASCGTKPVRHSQDTAAEGRDIPAEEAQERALTRLAKGPWAEHAGKIAFLIGYDEGVRVSKESGKPPMYFFTTTWCGWCKQLGQEAFMDEDIVALVRDRFTPVIVDGDVETTATRRFGVAGYPRLVFADMTGAVVATLDGYRPKEEVRRAVQGAADRLPRAAPTEHSASLPGAVEVAGAKPELVANPLAQ